MTYVTRAGTTVRNKRAAGLAIVEEQYHRDDIAEYDVTRRFTVRGEEFAEEGDRLLARPSTAGPGFAWVVNLTWGTSAVVSWETFCHGVRPRERRLDTVRPVL